MVDEEEMLTRMMLVRMFTPREELQERWYYDSEFRNAMVWVMANAFVFTNEETHGILGF